MSYGNGRILVVDDEPRYLRLIRVNLEASGYEVVTTDNGQSAIELAASQLPDLILLDIMLPGKDGYVACAEIRRFSQVPIIMLTALGRTNDIVRGLDAGADDYIPKPFSAQELLARIRARLRRGDTPAEGAPVAVHTVGDLTVDLAHQRVELAGKEVHLSRIEFRLLAELITRAGKVVPPELLLDKVWDYQTHQIELLWQAVHRVRRKIESDPRNPHYIKTRAGIGYVLAIGEDEDDGHD